jgi:hypothetical protein
LQPGQDLADQIQTDAGTSRLQVSHAEGADLAFNRCKNRFGFFTPWRFDLSDALLEVLAPLREDEEQEI